MFERLLIEPPYSLKQADKLGGIAPGKLADLVILSADPTADIRNTRKIAAVIVNGRHLSRADLDKMLATVEAAATAK